MPSPLPAPPAAAIAQLVDDALREDLGDGDLTASLIDPQLTATARLICRQAAVLCGVAWFEAAFRRLDATVDIRWQRRDGARLRRGTVVCEVHGAAQALLSAERTAINLLQTLSGTATAARRYVTAAGGRIRILDTRKTLPGMRLAQKYAVAVGGAHNHRHGLYDAILIKENHLAALGGSVAEALRRAGAAHPGVAIEIEVDGMAQLRAALAAGATRILLDNFDAAAMREAVAVTGGRAELEASGNVSLGGLAEIAASGVDCVSIGALTKHVRAVDFSLQFAPLPAP